MKKRRFRPFTLIEIMIVIALIGLIGSVVAYNLKGSLEEGKAFKTEQAMSQIVDVLWLEVAKGESFDTVAKDWDKYIGRSPLVKNPDKLIQDGWNKKFDVKGENGEFIVSSTKYNEYKK
jgi:general secretion pathway protein G